ncbi:transmembrane signal receptor [Lithospermum erythrorhizon]|uniref:Transmembrane signal receptor n=1 Tax=Lithospermum erythrorhizon TaxID=34254 RepID=A0AAV3P6Y8_LITER
MYLTSTRPDIMFATCLISRYMAKPTELHLQIAKRILRYLKGSTQYGIFYTKGKAEGELMVYTDSDYVGDLDDKKSTSGYVVLLNSGAVAWCSKKQPIVTLSTTEAEFVAATVCACQAIWMKRILNELVKQEDSCIVIRCDHSSSIKLSKNHVIHERCKHIDVRFHFLRNLVKEGTILLTYCSSTNQIADVMTKALKIKAFVKLRTELGMVSIEDIS